ncbi:LCP family protein [Plantactinospora endophytica]|uniref:Transcriptional regulator n=1 Tax=Plantactinospora endophytica TaxID=673535 RepID=A0ABQ4E9G5_9ACTN|nr:LCP family protein [Plantactinospora endophytica]GIG91375.1 transcriptional regulator [Plantactinospora endophytica]
MPHQPQLAESDSTEVIAGTPDGSSTDAPAPKRRRRTRRIILITLLVLALLGGGGAVAAGIYVHRLESGIERVEAFDAVPEESRPVKVAKDAKNILILGSDTRDPSNTGGSRSDTIILAHLPADRSSAQLVSIPRDTWVNVPKSKDGKHGGRDAKINAAYAWGGIPLMVQTVEKFTGVRVDHVAIVDFAGFKEIVDALGGVQLTVEESFTSTHSLLPTGRREFKKGPQVMDGAQALDYARERYAFKDGDFARIRHQQQVIRAILDKAASGGTLANPAKLNSFIRASADAVSVDKTLSMLDMGMELRHLRSGNLTFITSPTKGTGNVGSESVVFAKTDEVKTFYDAVRRDAVPEILKGAK